MDKLIMEIFIKDEQIQQLVTMHKESDVAYSDLINSAISEFFNNFMAEMKRSELKRVK